MENSDVMQESREFIGKVNHALNNHFTGASGYLDLLLEHLTALCTLDEKSHQYAESIRSSLQDAISLNKKLSEYAHSGKIATDI